MKEIGERLKEARESIGVSIEEAAEDLKLQVSQLEDIEQGNKEAFKDVFSLKFFIRDYSKYLGLNYDEMVEEFNEYLFDYTSKISIDDIKKSNKKEKKEENKIVSPYTVERRQEKNIPSFLIWGAIGLVVIIIMIVLVMVFTGKKEEKNIISYKEEYHEFA